MFKTRIKYKGYVEWHSSEHIIMLYISKTEIGSTYHALSFDNGETWCIGNSEDTLCNDFKGSFTDAIDVCVELNKGGLYEKQ